jgi:allantoate deiminase
MSDDVKGYLEFHIEQGPVLEQMNLPLAVVDTIVGQIRYELTFNGQAGHAGATPMELRHDALAAAAEWIGVVERTALEDRNIIATVGQLEVHPGAANVVPGSARASLDVRGASDAACRSAAAQLLSAAHNPRRRGVVVSTEARLVQSAVPMDRAMSDALCRAVTDAGHTVHRMNSGAGHDAMILARRVPAALLFLRSPGAISHHPDETVFVADVDAALDVGMRFLESWSLS